MRIKTLLFAGMFLVLPLSMRADDYQTFNLQDVTFQGGQSATGSLTIDQTTGTVTSANIVYGAYTFSLPYLTEAPIAGTNVTGIFVKDAATDVVNFILPTTSLQTYTGGSLCGESNYSQPQCDNYTGYVDTASAFETMNAGSLVAGQSWSTNPSATPEPSSLLLLGTGLLGGAGAMRRRFLSDEDGVSGFCGRLFR